MTLDFLLSTLSEFALVLTALGVFVALAFWRGRQSLITTIIGLYMGLLIFEFFPYTTMLTSDESGVGKIVIFTLLSAGATLLMVRLMPAPYRESTFESVGKKILLAIGATIIVLAIGFTVLQAGVLIGTEAPFQGLFSSEQYFFWWLLVPLATLLIAA